MDGGVFAHYGEPCNQTMMDKFICQTESSSPVLAWEYAITMAAILKMFPWQLHH